MSARGEQLHATATTDGQIAELISLLITADRSTLRRPCGGREKLGDGTIAANAWHTAENYQRIAEFASPEWPAEHRPASHRADPVPRIMPTVTHRPPDYGANPRSHGDRYAADDLEVKTVLEQLATTRRSLRRIGELTDQQLDAVPPEGSFRFCDGQRTLEQVLASLLKHQRHQLDALHTASS